MAFYGYKGDIEDCHWTPYSSYNYDTSSASVQLMSEYDSSPSTYYNEYESSSPELNYYHDHIQYHSWNYSDDLSETNDIHSFFEYTEPKLLQYQPPPSHYYTHYFPSETKFTISYSKLAAQEVDDTEFDQYDPTPYSGGYDPVSTYGKPLPPSDEICYPRSTPKPDKPISGSGFMPSPYGKVEDSPPEKIPPSDTKPVDTETDPGEEDVDEESIENGVEGDYDHEIGDRRVTDDHIVPYGSGLEAVDLCESIFGYWPCLEKIERQQRAKCFELCEVERRYDPFQLAADYLFGSFSAYGNDDDNHRRYYRAQM